MRFLHTSDWHVGRSIRGRSREGEHEAALQQTLTYAKELDVDCLLVAGDIFDTSTPSPESERIVYDFFRELHGLGVPAVVIAGNHDHPRRFDAIAPLLRAMNVHMLGDPRGAHDGGCLEIQSRDERESAKIAALPWVTERRAIDFVELQAGPGTAIMAYAEQVAQAMNNLTSDFRADTVNVLMAHALINDARVGSGGGERAITLAMNIFGLRRERLPVSAQYIALGHVHKAQELVKSPPAWYCGSLMQLDFGEVNQEKSVNLVEIHTRQSAVVKTLHIDKGVRRLVDVGSPLRGVALADLASKQIEVGDAWLRVFVDLDIPVPNLADLIRESLPNTVQVERIGQRESVRAEESEPGKVLEPEELFANFYRYSAKREPTPDTLALFRRLLAEESDATS